MEREGGRLRRKEEYRELRKGQGKESRRGKVKERYGEGRESMEGWQIKK